MKKTLFALTLLAAVSMAHAQQSAWTGIYNHGETRNTTTSFAQSTGTGTAYSAATGSSLASSSGNVYIHTGAGEGVQNGGILMNGKSETSNTGTAFNISTGRGTGSASSVGFGDSDVSALAMYSAPGQWMTISGSSDSGMVDRGLNGTDISVFAGRNTGGFAEAATNGSFRARGSVGSVVTYDTGVNKNVYGSVRDVKNTTSSANTGALIVNGTQLQNAQNAAQAGTVVIVNGAYGDPL